MPIAKTNGTTEVDSSAVEAKTTGTVEGLPNKWGGTYSKVRDYDAEARVKVACVAFNAALTSPGLAGLPYTSFEEFIALVRKAADASVAYTWEEQK